MSLYLVDPRTAKHPVLLLSWSLEASVMLYCQWRYCLLKTCELILLHDTSLKGT